MGITFLDFLFIYMFLFDLTVDVFNCFIRVDSCDGLCGELLRPLSLRQVVPASHACPLAFIKARTVQPSKTLGKMVGWWSGSRTDPEHSWQARHELWGDRTRLPHGFLEELSACCQDHGHPEMILNILDRLVAWLDDRAYLILFFFVVILNEYCLNYICILIRIKGGKRRCGVR